VGNRPVGGFERETLMFVSRGGGRQTRDGETKVREKNHWKRGENRMRNGSNAACLNRRTWTQIEERSPRKRGSFRKEKGGRVS